MTSSLVIAYLFLDKFNLNNDVYTVEDVRDFTENGTNGYTFLLAPRIDGLRACLKNEDINTEISVVNGRVYSFSGLFRTYDESTEESSEAADEYVFSALDVLDINYDHIKSLVGFKDSIELFDRISLIDVVYVYDDELNYVPAYKMIIGGKIFYFSTLSGEVF